MHSPERIFGTLNAFQRTRALQAAIRLDLFTAIDEGVRTPAALSERCAASERGIRILCDYLVLLEFLVKDKGGYSLHEESKLFLSKRSPAYLGSATEFMNSEIMMRCFDDLEQVVRRGGTLLPGEGSVDPENHVWVEFARTMAPMMQKAASGIAEMLRVGAETPLKVLDVAAGHGVFGISIAKRFPKAAVTALDWGSVLEVAKENAEKAGVSKRYTFLAGSAFEVPLPERYDVILITNFLHHFDAATCVKFLSKVRAALNDGGRVITVEFVPNEDRVSPPVEAAFALIMLASTQSGDAYTFSEYQKMFTEAGFARSQIFPLAGSPEHVIVSEK